MQPVGLSECAQKLSCMLSLALPSSTFILAPCHSQIQQSAFQNLLQLLISFNDLTGSVAPMKSLYARLIVWEGPKGDERCEQKRIQRWHKNLRSAINKHFEGTGWRFHRFNKTKPSTTGTYKLEVGCTGSTSISIIMLTIVDLPRAS